MNVRDIIIGKCSLCGGWVHAGQRNSGSRIRYEAMDPPPTCLRCGAPALPTVQMNERRKADREKP